MNTVLNAELVDDIDGGMGLGADAQDEFVPGAHEDDATSTVAAFRVLKSMVERWYAAASNDWANELLCNFYRWLRTTGSKLHDPDLFKMVRNMLNKVFLQLIGELRQLGATFVSACYNRIIICTGKENPATAAQYLDYLLDTIVAKPLFSKVCFRLPPRSHRSLNTARGTGC